MASPSWSSATRRTTRTRRRCTASRWSPGDGRSWSRTRLPGEAYQAPAVSPSGTYAAWLVGETGQYVEWSATTRLREAGPDVVPLRQRRRDPGRRRHRHGDGDRAGAAHGGAEGCAIGVHTRDLAGAQTHMQVTGDTGCTEGSFENVDALTVLGGGPDRAIQLTLARAVGRRALGGHQGRRRPTRRDWCGTATRGRRSRRTSSTRRYPGSPIVAIGSPDRHQILVQRFDEATQTWGPQTQVFTTGRRCRDAYLDLPTSTLYVADLLLRERPTSCWSAPTRRAGRSARSAAARGRSTDGGVALPGKGGTTVVRADGVARVPGHHRRPVRRRAGRTARRAGPAAREAHGWPSKVQVSTGGAFRTVSKARRFADAVPRRSSSSPTCLDARGSASCPATGDCSCSVATPGGSSVAPGPPAVDLETRSAVALGAGRLVEAERGGGGEVEALGPAVDRDRDPVVGEGGQLGRAAPRPRCRTARRWGRPAGRRTARPRRRRRRPARSARPPSRRATAASADGSTASGQVEQRADAGAHGLGVVGVDRAAGEHHAVGAGRVGAADHGPGVAGVADVGADRRPAGRRRAPRRPVRRRSGTARRPRPGSPSRTAARARGPRPRVSRTPSGRSGQLDARRGRRPPRRSRPRGRPRRPSGRRQGTAAARSVPSGG